MRHRLIRIFTVLLILCCLSANAFAQSDTEEPTVNLEGVHSLFEANGCLYACSWSGPYRFDEQNENPAAVMPDGEGLYASRMTALDETFFSIDNMGVLSSMTLTDERLSAPQTVAALPVTQEEGVYTRCTGLIADDSAVWVLWAVSTMESVYDSTTLYRVDRKDGTVAQVEAPNILDICQYRDGYLLARQWDRLAIPNDASGENAPKLVSINKSSLSVETLCTLPDGDLYSPAYDELNDLIYIASPSKLLRLGSDFQAETCAYLSLQYINDGDASMLCGGRYLLASGNEPLGFVSSATDPSLMPAKVLNLAMPYMDDVTSAFCRAHPEIAVNLMDDRFFSAESVAKNMVAKVADADVYSIYLGSIGSISPLRDKGYYVDLSQSKIISDAMNRMYPQLTSLCFDNAGKPFALPFSVHVLSMGYSPSALKKLGMTMDDLPRTYEQLLDFAALFADESMDNDWNLTFFESIYDIRQQLFDELQSAYVNQHLLSGEELTFDTPLFRSLLEKLDNVSSSILCLNPESGEAPNVMYFESEAPSLLMARYELSPDSYRLSDYEPLLLVFEEPQTPAFNATEQVLVINPYSANIDLALLYLEYMAEHIDPYTVIAVFPDANEPIESEHYQQQAQISDDTIADLQERLKAADDESRSEVQDALNFELRWRERLEDERWNVSAEQIAAYREQAASIVLNWDNELASSSIIEITSRYLQGALTADQYVDELEQRLRLMRLED